MIFRILDAVNKYPGYRMWSLPLAVAFFSFFTPYPLVARTQFSQIEAVRAHLRSRWDLPMRQYIGGPMSHTPDEIISVYNFLKQTPEGNLRKMLVDTNLTDLHFRTLMKLAKGGPEADFIDAFTNENLGKIRLSAKEQHLKEKFWAPCKQKLISLGLLSKATAKVA